MTSKLLDFILGYLGGKVLDGYNAVKYIDNTPYIRIEVLILAIVLLYAVFCCSKILKSFQFMYMERIDGIARGEPQTLNSETSRHTPKVLIKNSNSCTVEIYESPGQDVFIFLTDINNSKAYPQSNSNTLKP